MYTKAEPEATYEQMEQSFRTHGFNFYLIATVKFFESRHSGTGLKRHQ